MMVEIRKLGLNDGLAIKDLLAPMNEEQVKLFKYLLHYSDKTWLGFYNNEIAAAWGMVPTSLLSNSAYIWSVALDRIRGFRKTFLQQSKLAIAEMLAEYPILVCHCIGSSIFVKHIGGQLVQDHGDYTTFIIRA